MQTAKLVLIALLLSACLPAQGADMNWKHVLVLHSYHDGYPFTEAESKGINAVLSRQATWIEQHVVYMDSKRITSEEYHQSLAQLLKIQFAKQTLDAVLVTDNDALDFVVKNRETLFRGMPVVFAGINDFDPSMLKGQAGITGVEENTDYAATIELALKLRPAAKHVVVVTDGTTTGKAHIDAIRRLAPGYSSKADTVFLSLGDMTMDEMLKRMEGLEQDSVVLIVNHYREKNGRVYSHEQSMELIVKACPAPVFTVNDIRLGWGVVGGKLVRGFNQGHAAAEMLVRVLRGEDIARIPIETKSPNDWMFDHGALRRWNIDERELPAGSIVVNRPVSFYSLHRGAIHGATAVFLILILIIWLQTTAIARRKVVEAALLKANNAYRALVACTSSVAQANNENELLSQVVKVVLQQCGYRMAWIGLAENDEGRTIRPVAQAGFDDGYLAQAGMTWHDTELGRGPTGTAIRTGEPCVNPDTRTNPAISPWREAAEARGYISNAALPMRTGGRILGALTVYATKSNAFTQEEISLLQEIADNLAFGLASLKAKRDRDKAEEQLRQSQKMEAVGRLAGGVAHDFNNLLTAILGYAEMATGQCPADSPLRGELEEISKAGTKAAGLTRQLLAFSRKQVISPVVLDLNELISHSSKMLQRVIGEDIELAFLPKPAAGNIKADPSQIEQIVVNLAANARDAMPGGGKLTFETANVLITEEYVRSHSDAIPGRWVMLAASDNGKGMTEPVRQHIFEPFFTTKEIGKGTGLGLATVYGIVMQSGGFINVYSEPGVGTTFKIYFPMVDSAPLVAGKADLAALPPAHETVLLVEDDNSVRELARMALTRQGYQVRVAPDAAAAIAIFEKEAPAIDLLITDVVMPRMNGRQLYDLLAAIKPQLKALFMSGYTENVIAQHGILDAGMNFIQKPYGMDQLARKVRDILHG